MTSFRTNEGDLIVIDNNGKAWCRVPMTSASPDVRKDPETKEGRGSWERDERWDLPEES